MCLHVMSVKEVNYMFPQGSTQWKVVQSLLKEESHLQNKTKKIKEGRGEKNSRHRSRVSVQQGQKKTKQAWNEVRCLVTKTQSNTNSTIYSVNTTQRPEGDRDSETETRRQRLRLSDSQTQRQRVRESDSETQLQCDRNSSDML